MTTSRIYAYRWPARLVSHKPFAAESYSITPSCIWQVFFRKKNEFSFLFSPFCQRAHFLCKMHNPQAFPPVENSAVPAAQCLVWTILPLLYIYNKKQGRSTTVLALSVKACRLCQLPRGPPLSGSLRSPAPPERKDFPRPGLILPAPGRNVTVGDKEGSRCRAATKGGIWHRAAMTERVRAVLPKETSVGKLPLPSTTPSREKANRQSPQALPVCKH